MSSHVVCLNKARLLQLSRILQLQRAHLPIERHAATLQLALRIELLEAIGVSHELLRKADAGVDELVGPGLLQKKRPLS